MPNEIEIAKGLASKGVKVVAVAVCTYALTEYAGKDYGPDPIKPAFCYLAGIVCIGLGAKVSYDASGKVYDTIVKPLLKKAVVVS